MAKSTVKSAAAAKAKKKTTQKLVGVTPGTQVNFANFQLFIGAINTSGNLVFKNQTKANGPFNKSWTAINKKTYETLSCATTADGRVAMVATDAKTGDVNYIAETKVGSGTSGRWLPAENLSTPTGQIFKQVVLTRDKAALDNVFGVTGNNNQQSIWWKYRNPDVVVMKKEKVTPPGSDKPITITVPVLEPPKKPWSDWVNINGILEGNLNGLRATNNANGLIVLSGVYFNGITWTCQQMIDDKTGKTTWSAWTNPGDNPYISSGDLTPVLTTDDRISMFSSTNDGILRSAQTVPGAATWDAWSQPGEIPDNVANQACHLDGDGNLYLAVLNFAGKGMQNQIYGALQTNTDARQWTSWQPITLVPAATHLEMDYNADGALTLFAYDSASTTLRAKKQVLPNSTEWHFSWAELGTDVKCFSITKDLTP